MDLIPLTIGTKCVLDEAGLYEHMRLALERGLPLLPECGDHGGTVVLVGSGASVKGQLESIRKQREAGYVIVAIKDAHDWLLENGVVPDYAVAVDPQEHRWNCFSRKNEKVKYLIASQCHPAMFDHLKDQQVYLWHLYMKKGQTYPPNSLLITGGTTTGLRAITLFYSLGFRRFELYGYDCCITDGALRLDGKPPREKIIQVTVAGKNFHCTTAMASQASEFQNLFGCMPDMIVSSHGEGVITAILEERKKYIPLSFIHYGNETMASYRYRCKIPALELEVPINNLAADVVVFTKPAPQDVDHAIAVKKDGRTVIVDYCDDHFDSMPHYRALLCLANAVTCPTETMAARIKSLLYAGDVTVITDPYEFPEVLPHCSGDKLLWFGHETNLYSLQRVLPALYDDYMSKGKITIICGNRVPGCQPWSQERMPRAFAEADIVILPATATYKSANRAVEAIRQGCFVVAEPHPSINDFPGIWIGDIREGIEWASQNPKLANERTRLAQSHIEKSFAPRTQASAWKNLYWKLKRGSTSAAAASDGTVGSTSMDSTLAQTLSAISGLSTFAVNEQSEYAQSMS